ncbi:alpha-protein kinase 3 [Coregonus clupeaformis]|uniref:alpha-protein kinase 3 n=1 Tax=Coregonus clupeaformis TaxID=59861 RepID=UPI001BE0A611|nr:alpha-protein kinase 3 [Coregonus clupeaformis]
MTSRRPMTRSYSGNGRSGGSYNEDEVSSSNGRSESCNYLSNVRPENRSTLFGVMAQLTEDTQPVFETTLKSKAVSENCNVKLTCVVTGNPAPELTWYRDDMELDRYCGLPKYEIGRNGKTHTLQIYNCTVDDAAIYQASARNSKGIVSCSGVLEVGTMSEFKIHQRFFGKLKQKAENKKRELEESRRRGKENVQKEPREQKPLQSSPIPPQRKRRTPSAPSSPPDGEENTVSQGAAAVAVVEPNGAGAEVSEPTPVTTTENGSKTRSNDFDNMEIVTTKSPTTETFAKKKIKISNGVDSGVVSSNSSHTGPGTSENAYDGGISLAQFLAETLHSQTAEEKKIPARVEETVAVEAIDTTTADPKTDAEKQKEREEQGRERAERGRAERERMLGEEQEREKMSIEREKERAEQLQRTTGHNNTASEVRMEAKAHAHKEGDPHDYHHIQETLSNVLHSVKYFFFGKSKKDHASSEHHVKGQERDRGHPVDPTQPYPSPPHPQEPDGHPEVYKKPTEETVHMVVDGPQEAPKTVVPHKQLVSFEMLNPAEHMHGFTVSHSEKPPPAPKRAPESVPDSLEHVEQKEVCPEVMISSSTDTVPTSGLPALSEATVDQTQADSVPHVVVSATHEPNIQVFSSRTDLLTRHDDKTEDLHKQGPSDSPQSPDHSSGAGPNMSNLTSMGDIGSAPNNNVSPTVNLGLMTVTTESEKEKVMHVDEKGIGSVYETQEKCSRAFEEKGEKGDVKAENQPCPTLNVSVLEERREKIHNKEIHFKSLLPENSENDGQNIPEECHPVTGEDHYLNIKENSTLGLEDSLESALKVEYTPALEKSLVDSSFGNLKIQEQVAPIVQKKSEEQDVSLERNEVPTHTIERQVKTEEKVTEIKVELLGESKIHSETQPVKGSAIVSPEPPVAASVTSPEANSTNLGGYFGNVPEIRMVDSALKIPEIKIIVPEQQIKEEQVIIPNIEIMEPEVKEPTQPLIPITPNEPTSEPDIFQKDDANDVSDIMMTENSAAFTSVVIDVTPTQESMWNDDIIRPTEKVQEVPQPVEEAKTPTAEQPTTIKSERLTKTLIPTVNVSYTDDSKLRKMDHEHPLLKPPVLDRGKPKEAPKVPLCVVPPISESNELPKNGNKESESLADMLRGVKSDFENYTSSESDKPHSDPQKQTTKTKEQSGIDNFPSLSYKALVPTEVTTMQNAVDISFTEAEKVKPLKESRIESYIIGNEPRERNSIERLAVKPPTPPRSPSSLRRFTSRTPPAITVDDPPNSEKTVLEQSGGDTPTSSLSCESSPRLKRRDSLTLIRSATPEELASGARRKIFIPREGEGVGVVVALGVGGSPLDTQVKKEAPYMSPSQARRAALLQAPTGSQTPPLERRSPLLNRRKATLEVPKVVEEISTEEPESPKTEVKPPEEKRNPFKAPQVIRKIRGEPFPDASGHLKLWCQFFNVLSDSTIKWYRDEEEIVEVKRSGGDESQVALAIVQTSSRDCGVYGCSIKNEFGTDSTDFLLSVDLLSEYFLCEDLEVGEEIEMTPMLFTKGLADPGYWGDKFFGRIMTQEAHLGEGCAHKACRAKVIYGLDPVFESGTTCIIKVQSPIAYGTKQESNLAERNMEMTKQECKIQNTVREYCKIFAAEARVIENFGFSLDVSPLYMVYRPANSVPYATVEADLKGIFLKYCMMDAKGRLITRATSEVEMKCCSFQHWIHQWTNGNLLVTGLEGVGPKITKVRIVTKSKGYQGLTDDGSPKVFEQFLTQHQCNYYCGLLSLRTLKPMDTLQQPPKIKGSRSPLLGRKLCSSSPQHNRKLGSSSPQLQRKGLNSPLTTRKATSSPKVPRKTGETDDNQSTAKPKAEESLKVVV